MRGGRLPRQDGGSRPGQPKALTQRALRALWVKREGDRAFTGSIFAALASETDEVERTRKCRGYFAFRPLAAGFTTAPGLRPRPAARASAERAAA